MNLPAQHAGEQEWKCRRLLVVGALGVVGRANVEYLTSLPDWEVVALSRRAPDFETRAKFVSADLTNAEDCHAALKGHSDISRVIFAALHEQPSLCRGGPRPTISRVNLAMLKNLMDAVEDRFACACRTWR